MKKFNIEIVETLSRIVEVEAEDLDAAYRNVWRAYTHGDIVLDESDYVGTDLFSAGVFAFPKERI